MSIITINPTVSNQNFSHTKLNENHKITGKFYGLQEQEIKDMKEHGFVTTVGYVHLILRFLNPYFDKALHINIPKFLKKWNVAKSSFHKAIAKLCETGIITLGTDKEIIFTSNPHQNNSSQAGDRQNASETSVSSHSNVSQVDPDLSLIRDTDIYIDCACDKTNKTNKNLNQTVVNSDARAVNIYPEENNSNSEDNFLIKSDKQTSSHTDPLAKEPTSTPTPNQENLNSREDQSSEACSTVESKESHKMKAEGELENPSVNSTQTVLQRGLEYEEELSKKSWQKIDFTSEDRSKLKQLQKYTENPYLRPWRKGRVNYIKNLIPTLQRLNSWYLKSENRGKGYERSHLENLEKAIAHWENNPFRALDAYDKMMKYLEASQGEIEEPTSDRVVEGQQEELLSLLGQSLGFEDEFEEF